MKFLKSYTTKVGKNKDRDSRTASLHTSAITSSIIKSPQADATSLLSETIVYQPPTAVTPVPNFAARASMSTPFIRPATAVVAATGAELDHLSRTLLVMHAKAPPSGEKEKDEKMEAAASYMYGPKVSDSFEGEKKTSSTHSDMQPPRTNRAQALRKERNATRINEEKLIREQLMKQRVMRAASDTNTTGGSSDVSSESEDSDNAGEPIHARVIPKSLYHKPKITVRDTLSSKFRYLFNRKPAGVNVYFKQADDKDPKKKPPFVLASKQHCF